jgi:hypothetical protein
MQFFYIKKKYEKGASSGDMIRRSVAGVSGVPTAPRVVVAPLGAVMLAAARAASRAAAGAAAEEAGDKAGLSAVAAAFTAVTSGTIVLPGTAVAGTGTRVTGADGRGV